MYRFVRTRSRVHRVHVEGGQAWKVEQCNLDDAAYFGLLDEEPEGVQRCAYCWRSVTEERAAEPTEEQVPALGKSDVPRSLMVVPKRLLVALLAIVAGFLFLTGSAGGVVLSPDIDPAPPAAGIPTPTPLPSCDPMTLAGCGDLVIIIEKLIDEQLLHHLEIDHAPEVTPWPSPTSSASPAPSASRSPDATAKPRSGSPPASARPTARPTPRPTPRPTARPTTPPSTPTPTPCFRPGKPQGGKDPCSWPPDD